MNRIIFVGLLLISISSQAATIIVTNINDSGLGSLRDAIANAVNGDVIRFDPNLLAGSPTITLQSEIAFSKSLNINGLYNTTDTLRISGNNICRIFNISNTTSVVLDSLVLINGYAADSTGKGGAVHFSYSSSLGITNSLFKNNTSVSNGGGVYCKANQLSINSCVFYDNISGGSGGGVYCHNNLNCWGSKFFNNTSNGGSGVGIGPNNFGNPNYINFYGCTIKNNTANYSGGGVNVSTNGHLELVFSGCQIDSNIANNNGGGIRANVSAGVYTSCVIVLDNTSVSYNVVTNGDGGGIYATAFGSSVSSSSSNVNMTRSSVCYNTCFASGSKGGGIFIESNGQRVLDCKRSTISNNNADFGGGVYEGNNTASSFANITNSTIYDNNAYSLGSSIYSVYSTIESSIVSAAGNNIYSDVNSPITSNGYNIFSDAPNGTIGTDQINITPSQLNLLPLTSLSFGITQFHLPLSPSPAIDMGNPSDMTTAQNGPILNGRRDVGAVESCASGTIDYNNLCQPSFTWTAGDGNTYTNDTTVYYLLPATNSMGCDSFLILSLNSVIYSTDTIVSCDSLTWIDGLTYISSTNTPTFTLTNINGCDSVVTLNLTVNSSTSGTDVITNCDSITWIDGITYTSSTNTPMVTLTDINGCDSVVTLNLTVNNINTNITQNSNTLTVGEVGATYQWLDCNNGNVIITGETNQSYNPATNGDYAVAVTKNGCTDTSACINFIITGINELETSFVKIYPNPTTSEFIVELVGNSSEIQLSIVSIEGKTVYTNNTINTNKINVDAADWSKGVYIVKITSKQSSKVMKLIKQ